MQQESAETLALNALSWLAANDDLMPVFLGSSGASEGDLAQLAREAEFLGSVLDFLLMDDAWIIAFCDATGLAYNQPQLARYALPGGIPQNWT